MLQRGIDASRMQQTKTLYGSVIYAERLSETMPDEELEASCTWHLKLEGAKAGKLDW